jgi:hypothetical protein
MGLCFDPFSVSQCGRLNSSDARILEPAGGQSAGQVYTAPEA